MNAKLKCLACMLAIVMIFGSVTCSANQENSAFDLTINELYLNRDTGVVTVSGKVLNGKTKVTIIAYYPDNSGNAASGIPTGGTIKDMVYTLDEKQTDENGNFTFNFTITEDSPAGEYRIVIGVKGMVFSQENREGIVTFMNQTEKAQVTAAFNAVQTDTAMDAFFEQYGELFVLPDFYDDTYGAEETAFNKIVVEYRNTYYNTGTAKMTDIEKILRVSEEIYKIPTLTAGDFDGFLKDNKALLNIDVANTEYLKYKAAVQNTLFGLINGAEPVKSWSKISSKFKETVILTAFNNATRADTDALLKKYSTDLNINVTGDYVNVDSVEMGKALVEKKFTDLTQIKTAFEKKLEELTKDNGGSGSSISGSVSSDRVYNVEGTGGSGGGGVSGGAASGFTDLGNALWAKEAILSLKDRGIISGMTATQFCPNNSVTREQFVKMAVMAFGSSWSDGSDSFSDVSPDAWYAPYIKKAVAAGIVNGQSTDVFGVGQSITRQDVSVILYRIMKGKIASSSQSPSFKDWDAVAPYATESVSAMYGASILTGDDKGFFNPAKVCTRAEAAKMIYGALILMEKGV